jgi:lactaldehyde reductase
METKRLILNETSYFGQGAIQQITTEISRRGYKKALVVTDKDLVKFNVAGKVLAVLENGNVPYVVFDEVKANPTVNNVKLGVAAYKAACADFIIAIGGGSPIDTAKAIGIITNNPEFSDVKSLEGVADTKKRTVPIIAVPTTAGTAAEVTINYVITDEEAVKKMVCVDPNDIPELSIVDPEMMVSMPKGLTAATGMDALTHAIEGFITRGAWIMTDMFEIKAIELIAQHLENAVNNPTDLEARNGMALGQYIAGMGFSNVGLGIVHSMAHPLGACYDTPHGVANALLLPYVMEYNAPASGTKYQQIAKAMGVDNTEGMSADQYRNAAVKAVKALSLRIGIPQKLVEIGVKEEDLPKLAQAAFNDVCTPGNPRDTSVEDILVLYKKAFK